MSKLARQDKPVTPKPLLVHCSAGIGRTGTLIAIFNIIESLLYSAVHYNELKSSLVDNSYMEANYPSADPLRVSVFGCVRKLREQRMLMVKKVEQYQFVHAYIANWVS